METNPTPKSEGTTPTHNDVEHIVLSGRMRTIDTSPAAKTTWVVLAPSAYRPSVMCIVGEGKTENAAWCDAVGDEWNKCVTHAMIKKFYAKYEGRKGFVVRHVTDAEYRQIHEDEQN